MSGLHRAMSFLSFFARALCLSQFSSSYFCPTWHDSCSGTYY